MIERVNRAYQQFQHSAVLQRRCCTERVLNTRFSRISQNAILGLVPFLHSALHLILYRNISIFPRAICDLFMRSINNFNYTLKLKLWICCLVVITCHYYCTCHEYHRSDSVIIGGIVIATVSYI